MESIAEQLQMITVRLEGHTENGLSVGTGFLYMHKDRLFVVTNKHVIRGVAHGSFMLHKASVNSEGIKTCISGEGYVVNFSESNFIGHENDNIDVSVMNISEHILNLEKAGNLVFWKNIDAQTNPQLEDYEKFISPIEEIVFIGYPSGIWDSHNLLPIVRKGITATPCYVSFQGEPKFLIDASVFPGSSGSPVFLYYSGSYADKLGNLYAGSRAFFLGILAEVFQRLDDGDIKVKEVPTAEKPYAEYKQMIDLGIVFNAATVIEAVDHYMEKVK